MRLPVLIVLMLLCSATMAQKKFSFQVKGLPVRQGIIYKPVTRLEGDLRCPVNGALIETAQDSCFAITDGEVTAVFDLGNEYACVVRYENNMRVTYAGLKEVDESIDKGMLISKGTFIGLLSKQNEMGALTFMLTNPKGNDLAFDKIIAFIRKNMYGNQSYQVSPSLTAFAK